MMNSAQNAVEKGMHNDWVDCRAERFFLGQERSRWMLEANNRLSREFVFEPERHH